MRGIKIPQYKVALKMQGGVFSGHYGIYCLAQPYSWSLGNTSVDKSGVIMYIAIRFCDTEPSYYHVCILAGDRPEMQQLERFVGVKGTIFEVVKEVSTDWEKLALALHFRGEIIREQRHFQPEAACHNILQRWLDGDGQQPVTWDTLLDRLEDIGHGTLAGYLRKEVVCAKDDSVDTAFYGIITHTFI